MVKVKRARVRLDDSRFPNTDIYNVRSENELENGFVGVLGDVEEANLDVYKLDTPTAESSIVLIASPAMVYDNNRLGSGGEDEYFMEAGRVVRAYGLKPSFIFSVTKEALTATATKGEYVVVGNTNKLEPASVLPDKGFAAKVVGEELIGGALSLAVTQEPTKYVVLQVVQN